MSGIVVSPYLKGIVRKLNSIVDERTASTKNLKGELKRIVTTLQTVAEVVADAEMRAESGGLALLWLQRLQILLYEVDDLIDELHIMLIQVSSSSFRLRFTFPLKSKLYLSLQRIHQDLVEIAEDALLLSFKSVEVTEVPLKRVRLRDASLFIDREKVYREKVFGRERDEKAIIDLSLKSVERVSVVPIIGPFGIGKTILARLIYNNESFYGDNFDLKFWLHLEVCHDILQIWTILSLQFFEKEGDGDIKQMEMEIQKLLENKRCLIVLDDLHDNTLQKSAARELIDMLSKGSAIIVTTRSRRAASSIGTTPAYLLQPLSSDASYQLFSHLAFPNIMQISGSRELMAREFVKFCCGVPLVLHLLGSFLQEKDTVHKWTRLLEELHDNGFVNIVGPRLMNVVPKLPSDLSLLLQCFCLEKASCGGLSVEGLTCVWMALGFLYSDDRAQPPEYIARKYLTEFVECALCPDVQYAPGGVVRNINFNEALYDLATCSEHQSWAIVRDEEVINRTPKYIIWDQDCLRGTRMPSDYTSNPEKIRLFMVSSTRRRRDCSVQFVRNILSSLVRLRVLGLGGCDLEILPDSIGRLKYLRYLDLGRNHKMKRLPDTICNLWHLQTLFLHGCNQLQGLPDNIGSLQNLRYLTLTILTERLPEAIGQLTSLRTSGLTSCPNLASFPSTIKYLKNLETLGVVNCPELDFAANSSVEGFNGLDSINTLLLSHLPNFTSLPSDLGMPSVALKHLEIQSCTSLTETKWIAQFRYLRSLTIVQCSQLSDLALTDGASQLDGLLELVIRSCPSLGYTAWIREFVSLRSLIIDSCPKLVELDPGFRELKNLERMEIRGCPALSNWLATPAGKDWRHIAHVRAFEVDGSFLES